MPRESAPSFFCPLDLSQRDRLLALTGILLSRFLGALDQTFDVVRARAAAPPDV